MLVDLTKKELKALCEFISYNNDIDKELDAIYDKLGGISNACTCKEDSNAKWTTLYQQNWWNDWEVHRRMWTRSRKTWNYCWLLPSGVCVMQIFAIFTILTSCAIIGAVYLLNLYNPN